MSEIGNALMLIGGAGLVGGVMVGRSVRGRRALIAWPLWLALPFLVVGFIFLVASDSGAPPRLRGYDFGSGLALIFLLMAVPWLPTSLIGGLVGWWLRPAAPAEAQPLAYPPLADEPPDWSRDDAPLLSLDELAGIMYGAAELGEIDANRLPHVGPVREGEFIDRDEAGYAYVRRQDGAAVFERRSRISDQLLYWIFHDLARTLTAARLDADRRSGAAISETDRAARIAQGQQAILGDIDPTWERQFLRERAAPAGG